MEGSGLRGLGGAGFPAGRKWRIVRNQPAPRVMAVNIDEGEPGTFKDRTYLERDPHRFLEGLLVAAQVVGVEACLAFSNKRDYTKVIGAFNQALRSMKKDGTYDAIFNKYLAGP